MLHATNVFDEKGREDKRREVKRGEEEVREGKM